MHPLQHLPLTHKSVLNAKLLQSLPQDGVKVAQLGVVHGGEEVMQQVVSEGCGDEEQRGGLVDIADCIHLPEAPVSASVGVVTCMVDLEKIFHFLGKKVLTTHLLIVKYF